MSESGTIVLYRPIGPDELGLLERSGFRRWPPREFMARYEIHQAIRIVRLGAEPVGMMRLRSC